MKQTLEQLEAERRQLEVRLKGMDLIIAGYRSLSAEFQAPQQRQAKATTKRKYQRRTMPAHVRTVAANREVGERMAQAIQQVLRVGELNTNEIAYRMAPQWRANYKNEASFIGSILHKLNDMAKAGQLEAFKPAGDNGRNHKGFPRVWSLPAQRNE